MQDIRLTLDLGNGYIKGVMLANEDGKNIVLAKDMVRTKGMRKGRILDMDDFIYSIRSVLDSFEKKLGGDYFDEVSVGISHPEMLISRYTEQKRVVGDKIQQEDMEHLTNIIYDTTGKQNYETIKIIPVQWIIDDGIVLKDPIGMEGKKLEIVADVFMVPKNFYNTLTEVFEKLEIDINDVIPNILGSTEIALDFDAKDLGTLLVDIGTNQTTFAVYEEGYPIKFGVVPIGGEDVTKDVSIGMQLDIKQAEKLKKEKGYIYMPDEPIEENQELDVGFLSDIIGARYEEIFDNINKALVEIGKDGRLPGGIILIGGGSKIANLDKLAKLQFKLAASYGRDRILGLGEISSNVQFINAIGCDHWVGKYSNMSGGGISLGISFTWVKKLSKRFKDLF